MKGLMIRSPWIEMILSGTKSWEMRSRPTNIRGRIALIRAGSGQIVGVADLVECLPALTAERMRETQEFHGIPESRFNEVLENNWTTPWVLSNVVRFDKPVPYRHPSGAVTWVDLGDFGEPSYGPNTKPSNSVVPEQTVARSASDAAVAPASSASVAEAWVDIPLTEGNIRWGHIYLRAAGRLLPSDCIGGSNKKEVAPNEIHVSFEPGGVIRTDIAGDKMILRARAAVRDFFTRSGAKAGDSVRFSRTGRTAFRIQLLRSL